jgi:hypothetical protein
MVEIMKKILPIMIAVSMMFTMAVSAESPPPSIKFESLSSFDELLYMVENANDESLQKYLNKMDVAGMFDRERAKSYIDVMRHLYVPVLKQGVELEHLPFESILVTFTESSYLYVSYGNRDDVNLYFGVFDSVIRGWFDDERTALFCAEGEIEYHLYLDEVEIQYYGEEEVKIENVARIYFVVDGSTIMICVSSYDTPEEALEDIKKFEFVRLDEVGSHNAQVEIGEPTPEEVEEIEIDSNPKSGVALAIIPTIFAGVAVAGSIKTRKRK